jgi:hypothetical protein
LSGDALAQQDSVAGGNAKKFGDAPNRVCLEFVDRPIGKCDIPQHFHDFLPTVVVESTFQDASKIVEINSFAVALFRQGDQFRSGVRVEAETFLDDYLQPAALGEAAKRPRKNPLVLSEAISQIRRVNVLLLIA